MMKNALIYLLVLLPLNLAAQPSEPIFTYAPGSEIGKTVVEMPTDESYQAISKEVEKLTETKEYKKAIKLLKEYLKKNDTSAVLYTRLAILYLENGQYIRSLRTASLAADLNPRDPQNYNVIGISLYYVGNYEQSLNAYNQAIAVDPSFALAYYNRGILLYEIFDKKKAYADFLKARELNLDGTETVLSELFSDRSFR